MHSIPGSPPPFAKAGALRELARLAAEALAVGLFVSLVLGLAALIVASTTASAAGRDFATGAMPPADTERAVVLATVDAVPNAARLRSTKPADPGPLLLVPGPYDGDIGSFYLPMPDLTLDALPGDGWFALRKHAKGSDLVAVPGDETDRPVFLATLERTRVDDFDTRIYGDVLVWMRLPGGNLAAGPVTEVPLRRRALVPKLDHRYRLPLGDRTFELTAHNGRNGKDGAYYSLEAGGVSWQYLLPGYGFDHEIVFAGDLDRDGRPDLVVYVAASNAGAYYLLLSSRARPGLNAPTAWVGHGGC